MFDIIDYSEGTKFHEKAAFGYCQNVTATTINATTNSSIISSSSYSSGSSKPIINNFNANNCSNYNNNIVSNENKSSVLKPKFIDVNSFFKVITTVIIIDCRLLKEYENKHIVHSVHINCRDKITKKRLSSRKLSVKDIIGCENTKKKIDEKFSCQNITLAVIYDDSTTDDNDLYLDQNPLKIVLENIEDTFKNFDCKILKGGFKEFSIKYPDLCIQKENLNISKPIAYVSCEDKYKYEIDNAKLSKINDFIYLGNECDAKNYEKLAELGINNIINVTKNIPCYHENKNINYLRIEVNDACNQNLKQYFNQTNQFIDNVKNNKGKVLIHCQAGISRSPTIVIAYLMKSRNLTMNNAYNEVKEKRSIIGPNIVFLSQLMDYEKILTESIYNSNNELIINKCLKINTTPSIELCKNININNNATNITNSNESTITTTFGMPFVVRMVLK